MKLTKSDKVWVGFVVFAFVCMIIVYGILFKACSRLNDDINNKGLKGVLEEVWEGKNHAR